MRRSLLLVLLGSALLLLATETAKAQIWFGVGGWGGRGGFYVGSPYFSYGRGYYPYSYGWGGWRGYGNYPYRSWSYSAWPYYGYSYGPTWSSGYYSYPSYGYGYSSPYYYSTPSIYGYRSSPSYIYYDSTPSYATGPSITTYQSFYGGPERSRERAYVRVLVPSSNAQVWIDDQRMSLGGTERWFHTPDLSGDGEYHYTVRASWMEDGREVTREKKVSFRKGDEVTVSFLEPGSDAVPPGTRGAPGRERDPLRDDVGRPPASGTTPRPADLPPPP